MTQRIDSVQAQLNTRMDGLVNELAQKLAQQGREKAASGKPGEAASALRLSTTLLSASRERRLPARADFFRGMVTTLKEISFLP